MSFHDAEECFEDAKNYLNPEQDQVMWDLVSGLHALSQAFRQLEQRVIDIQNRVQ